MDVSEVSSDSALRRTEPNVTSRRRWSSVLLPTFAVAASLLTFPAALPWTIVAWTAWYLLRRARGRAAWPCLAACVAVVLVKRIPLFPSVLICLFLMGALTIVDLLRRRQDAEDDWAPSR